VATHCWGSECIKIICNAKVLRLVCGTDWILKYCLVEPRPRCDAMRRRTAAAAHRSVSVWVPQECGHCEGRVAGRSNRSRPVAWPTDHLPLLAFGTTAANSGLPVPSRTSLPPSASWVPGQDQGLGEKCGLGQQRQLRTYHDRNYLRVPSVLRCI
jgi:hypothetical protein